MQPEHIGLRQQEGNFSPSADPQIAQALPEDIRFTCRMANRSSGDLGVALLGRPRLLLDSEEASPPLSLLCMLLELSPCNPASSWSIGGVDWGCTPPASLESYEGDWSCRSALGGGG